MKLVVSLATRGRPALLVDILRRTLPNIVRSNTMLIVMVDSDDHPTIKAMDQFNAGTHQGRLIVNVREREDTVAEKFNRALSEPADVYMAMVDHSWVTTLGFDQLVLDAAALFPEGIGMVMNHLANASFTSLQAMTRKLVDKLGYMFPPYFPYWFIDHWMDDIARLIDRISFADVVVDCSRKQATQEMREPAWWATWFDAAHCMRRHIANKIILGNDFHEAPWRKEILFRHHPLIEYRSRWVNESVRANAQAYTGMSNLTLNDPRYQRIKAKAIAMLPNLLGDYGMAKDVADAYRAALIPPTSVANIKRAYA